MDNDQIDDICDCEKCPECIEFQEEWDAQWIEVATLSYHPEVVEGELELPESFTELDWLTQADLLKDWIGILVDQYNKVVDEDYIRKDMATWKPVSINKETETD